PGDPSIFDTVQFFDFSSDPAEIGISSRHFDFGDGTSADGCCPTHRYAADGNYTVTDTVATPDGRSASQTQTVSVRTHDVTIAKLTVPQSGSAGQTRSITVGVTDARYPETVAVELQRSAPGGDFVTVGTLTQDVPLRSLNRTTSFAFTYTFRSEDATVGKVTFKAVATIAGARDALPGDNVAIALPTKVGR
ncbi:MAG: PKD domain-containing protein, partial [Gaiellaceae bacterium]